MSKFVTLDQFEQQIYLLRKAIAGAGGGGGAGVTSFAGRTGAVSPTAGDYTAANVGAPALVNPAVSGNLVAFTGTAGLQADSGSKAADFATAGHNHNTAYPALVSPSVVDNFVSFSGITGAQKDSGKSSASFEPALTKGNLTASGAIAIDNARQVIGGAAAISHLATAGNIHLPAAGSANQLLKNSGTAGTGAWGTVTENAGALAAITTVSMSSQLTNTRAIGTAPFVITSTTVCTNLNSDTVDGSHASAFELALGNPGTNDYVLSSKTDGTRSWVVNGAGGGEPALGNPAANGYILSSTAAGVRSWIYPSGPAFASTGAASAALSTVETIVVGGTGNMAAFIASTFFVGTTLIARLSGKCTAPAAAKTSTFSVRMGTNGTTADTQIGSVTFTSSGAISNARFHVVIMFGFTAVGATASIMGDAVAVTQENSAGLMGYYSISKALTVANGASNAANYLEVTYQSDDAGLICTFDTCTFSLEHL